LIVGVRHAFERVKIAGGLVNVTSTNVDEYTTPVVFRTDPLDAADAILLWVRSQMRMFNEFCKLSPEFDYPLFNLHNRDEFNLSFKFAAGQKWLSANPIANGGSYMFFTVGVDGWRHLDELRNTSKASRQAFVAMQFREEMFNVFDSAIKPAVEANDFKAFIVSRNTNNNQIDFEIIAALRRSAFVVADFTGERSAVFFEAGFGLGLGLPVIWTVQDVHFNKMKKHFDTRQYPYLIWKDEADLRDKLTKQIFATIEGARQPTAS
jgi:nucleoside 2-deoxyribosyltransferase